MIQQELDLQNTEAPHYMPHLTANGFEVINEDTIDTASGAIVEQYKVTDGVIANWIDHIWFILPDDDWVKRCKAHFNKTFSEYTDSDLVNSIDYVDNGTGGWNLIVTTITF